MKTLSWLVAGLFTVTVGPRLEGADAVVIERGLHHRLWRQTETVPLPDGRTFERASSYTELAHGMHYEQEGRLLESREVLELFQDGAIGRQTQAKVVFAPNIATPGAVDIETPDGKRLQCHVLGLGLYDEANQASLLLAGIKDSVGQLHAPNVLVYPDAFDDVSATLRYTYRRDGISQDVLLLQKITLPNGFNEATTRLEIWTEFVNPPPPILQASVRDGRQDVTVDFGAMQIGEGKAFSLNGGGPSFPVTKQWLTIEGRIFLVEAISVALANAELDRIGVQQAAVRAVNRDRKTLIAANARPFPSAPVLKRNTGKIETAAVSLPGRALVADFDLTGIYGSLTLKGDTTYYLSGDITVTNLIIEGGSVTKHATGATLRVASGGSVDCQTEPYRPAVFTSKNDNSIGTTISGSTGSPSANATFGEAHLHLVNSTVLGNLRFSYGNPGLYYDSGSGAQTLRHAQFVHCPTAIWIDSSSSLALGNALVYDSDRAIAGFNYTGVAENLTVSKCRDFSTNTGTSASLALTNGLLVNVTNWGNATITTNLTVKVSGTDILQTVGAGSAYLGTNSAYRNIGTTNITAALLRDLGKMTTYPPIQIEGGDWYTNNLDLSPQAQRDSDTPDLGAHYWPIDYVIAGLKLTNATITVSNGTTIAIRNVNSVGLGIGGAASFISVGAPDRPNRIISFLNVQEQATTNWTVGIRMITGWSTSAIPPRVTTRFTHWSAMTACAEHFYSADSDNGTHSFADSEFHIGDLYAQGPTLTFSNCLFNRSGLSLVDDRGTMNPIVRNSTFRGGSHSFSRVNGGTWAFTNNLFDGVAIPVQAAVIGHNYNGYTTGGGRLTNSASLDVLLAGTNISYQTGALGSFYLPCIGSLPAPTR